MDLEATAASAAVATVQHLNKQVWEDESVIAEQAQVMEDLKAQVKDSNAASKAQNSTILILQDNAC